MITPKNWSNTNANGEIVPSDSVSVIRRRGSDRADDYVTASLPRQLRKSANRARTDGVDLRI